MYVYNTQLRSILMVLTGAIIGTRGDFYCSTPPDHLINGVSSGRIITRREGATNYDNNMRCTWTIQALQADSVVQVSVVRSDLHWSPVGAICVGYDYMEVRDGTTTDSKELVTWCGDSNPRSFTSTGPGLLITFVTNDRNQSPFTGVVLDFVVMQRNATLGSCPPGWRDDPDQASGGESCYTLRTHKETWTDAQQYCNYDQGNLLNINSEDEDGYITNMVSTSSLDEYDRIWISLNDIAVDGEYRWLDGSRTQLDRWDSSNHEPEDYYNCIQMNKQGRWCEDFCNINDIQTTVRHAFICEKPKVGQVELYKIPSIRTDKGGDKAISPKRTWIILGSLVATLVVVIVIIIVIVVVCRRKKLKKQQAKHSPLRSRRQEPQTRTAPIREQESRQPPTAPPQSTNGEPQTVIVIHTYEPPPPNEAPPSYESSVRSGVGTTGL